MPDEGQRSYGALRAALIGYGTIACAYLLPHADHGLVSARNLLIAGILVQLALLLVQALVRRHVSDREMAAQVSALLELIGDAATVLLFALGTLGPVFNVGSTV
ncbi:hypothetical protein [Povalibacter sp.]|uniref:hypothetical protein n=1 Tax=Povalibacter sp. TaxID=1962978 RepID=UPI002F42D6BB